MMTDIFSSFDPHSFMSLHSSSSLMMLFNIIILITIQLQFWSTSSRIQVPLMLFLSIMKDQLLRTLTKSIKGASAIIAYLFFLIISINLLGMNPYSFSLSSHLIFTLALGLPLWLSFISSSFSKFPKKSTAHFLPDGAPDWLNPFLILIETTSVLVRPITLSFRLAANMSAGHIVLGLIGIYGSAGLMSSPILGTILGSTSLGYIMFELAICLIQAYIFCLLLSLYANEHAH